MASRKIAARAKRPQTLTSLRDQSSQTGAHGCQLGSVERQLGPNWGQIWSIGGCVAADLEDLGPLHTHNSSTCP